MTRQPLGTVDQWFSHRGKTEWTWNLTLWPRLPYIQKGEVNLVIWGQFKSTTTTTTTRECLGWVNEEVSVTGEGDFMTAPQKNSKKEKKKLERFSVSEDCARTLSEMSLSPTASLTLTHRHSHTGSEPNRLVFFSRPWCRGPAQHSTAGLCSCYYSCYYTGPTPSSHHHFWHISFVQRAGLALLLLWLGSCSEMVSRAVHRHWIMGSWMAGACFDHGF